MTVKIDGTNGVINGYDYQVPTTGFSYTFAAGTQVLVMNPAGTLATGTITMPAAPVDGMNITISSTQQITALTINANTGQFIVGGATALKAGGAQVFIYRLASTTWYNQDNNAAIPASGVTSLNSQTGAVSTVALYDIGSFIVARPQDTTSYAVNSTISGTSLYTVATGMYWDSATWRTPNGNSGATNVALVNTGSWRCVSPCCVQGTTACAGLWVRYA